MALRIYDLSTNYPDYFGMLSQIGQTVTSGFDKARKNAQEGEAAQLLSELAGQPQTASASDATGGVTTLASLGQSTPQQQGYNASGKMPSFVERQGATPSLDLAGLFTEAERRYALPNGYLSRTASIESRNDPNARNPNSSAEGLFQFTDRTARGYGLNNKFDPVASTDAAGRLAADNRAALKRALGRDPTPGELYLAHQQGAGGAIKLLSNPNARAVDVVGQDAVHLNGGDPNMTAQQFAGRWISKLDGRADAPAPGAQPAQFQVPGQAGLPGSAVGNGQIRPDLIRRLAANPYTRELASKLITQQLSPQGQYSLTTVGDQAVRFNQRTGAVEVVPGITKPNIEVKEVNGRLVAVDKSNLSTRDVTPDGLPQAMFNGNSVDAQALNYLVQSGQLTREQAAQVAAGKTITGPNGEILFAPPAALVGGVSGGPQMQPQQPPEGPTAQSSAAQPGLVQLTAPKAEKPTDGQSTTALYARRAKEADQVLSGTEDVGKSSWENIKSAVPKVGNHLVSEDFQKFEQAQRNFINALLRKESGAVIGPEEFDNARKQYFPQPGDSDAVLVQKRQNRQTAIEELTKAAGPAMPRQPLPTGVTAAQALAEAKGAYAKATPQQKAAIRQRLQSWGIDPSRLD